jgi:phosphonate transport system substrate-binding protein
MESNHGSKFFNGVISVPRDSTIASAEDLRGKRMAFGNRRSTTGRILAQAALVKAGIRATDLASYAYLGRHDKVAYAVAAGKYDAGATNENTFHKYAAQKGLRRILEFPCVTKPWAARGGLDEGLFAALRRALIELDDSDVLRLIARSGLIPARDSDYDLIREAMELASRFDPNSLTFGVYASERPSEVFKTVQPVIEGLTTRLAAEGDVQRIRTKVFPTYRAAIDALVHGDIVFGRFGPASYVLAKQANPDIRIIAREDDQGANAAGVFVVKSNSETTSLSQLEGRTFAFGSRLSTEGRYAAQAALVDVGVEAPDLASVAYLGRHDRVAYAVAAGVYDAGVLRYSAFEKYAVPKNLKVIGRFDVPHKVWLARAGLDQDLFALLQRNLLEMEGETDSLGLGVTGFARAEDREYDWIRERMEHAQGFE